MAPFSPLQQFPLDAEYTFNCFATAGVAALAHLPHHRGLLTSPDLDRSTAHYPLSSSSHSM
jgi:hypothetical protein